MTEEIGSEFHSIPTEQGCGLTYPIPGTLAFSGRTAIETVLLNLPKAKKALLPSYCCDSMLEPFRRAGIDVGFYPVEFEDGLIAYISEFEDANILLWCNYFGFHTPMPDLTDYVGCGGVIIEDVTHSLLSDRVYHPQSHYLVASLRKWEPIACGGYCAAISGELKHIPTELPCSGFLESKRAAMEMKAAYLTDGDEEKKSRYLPMFSESNTWLAENYSRLSIDPCSQKYLAHIDMEKQKSIRRRNAELLYSGLTNTVRFLFPLEDMDCPLFVPIILPEKRDALRKELTANQIYCPIHWPHPNANCYSNLYDSELSLICDQRYTVEDMQRIVRVIRRFLEG